MKITEKVIKTTDLGFSFKEQEALDTVYNIIDEMQKALKDNDYIMSIDTGEVVNINEFARVKGIIDCLMSHTVFEIK